MRAQTFLLRSAFTLLVLTVGCTSPSGSHGGGGTAGQTDGGTSQDAGADASDTLVATTDGAAGQDASATTDAGNAGAGSAADAGGAKDAGGAQDAGTATTGSKQKSITFSKTVCFDFKTGKLASHTKNDCGQMILMGGANADLGSPDFQMPTFCAVPGSFKDATEIPSDLSKCTGMAWAEYLEGFDGLAGTGYIIRDGTKGPYWRFHIVDNECGDCPKGKFRLSFTWAAL